MGWETVGDILEVGGAALLLWGLALTWAQWQAEPRPLMARVILSPRRAKARLRRAGAFKLLTSEGSIADNVEVVKKREVPAGDADESEWREFTKWLLTYVDSSSAAVSRDVAALREDMAKSRQRDLVAIEQRLTKIEALVGVESRRAALDGIGVAAAGSLLVLVGTLVAALA